MPIATHFRIQLLSQGTIETGGYRHEQKFASLLRQYLTGDNKIAELSESRFNGHVFSLWGYLKLWKWFYKHATGNINIVPLRGAIPAIVKSTFTRSKTIVVLHSEVQPYSSFLLKVVYKLLLMYLSVFKPKHTAIVTIARFWKRTFEQKGVSSHLIHIIPNVFDPAYFARFITPVKQKQIHLGLAEPKTDQAIYELAKRLSAKGFFCYFSTLDALKQKKRADYEVVYFAGYEKYLTMMAQSEFTVQFPAVNEGWSRIAHESILVGTKVIGLAKGGLTELLAESGSIVVKDIDGFEKAILEAEHAGDSLQFIDRYSESNAESWFTSVLTFCRT